MTDPKITFRVDASQIIGRITAVQSPIAGLLEREPGLPPELDAALRLGDQPEELRGPRGSLYTLAGRVVAKAVQSPTCRTIQTLEVCLYADPRKVAEEIGLPLPAEELDP